MFKIQYFPNSYSRRIEIFLGKGGLFRNRRLSNIRKFHNEKIVEWMAPAFAVRDSVNQMIGMLNTKEWDVKIHTHSQQDFEYFQVNAE